MILEKIDELVTAELGISIHNKDRGRESVAARNMFMGLCLENLSSGRHKKTLKDIGEYVSKSHCSVIASRGRLEIDMFNDKYLVISYNKLNEQIKRYIHLLDNVLENETVNGDELAEIMKVEMFRDRIITLSNELKTKNKAINKLIEKVLHYESLQYNTI